MVVKEPVISFSVVVVTWWAPPTDAEVEVVAWLTEDPADAETESVVTVLVRSPVRRLPEPELVDQASADLAVAPVAVWFRETPVSSV